MVTIIGNGMGAYDFSNIHVDFEQYDRVICDQNFTQEHTKIKKLPFKEAKQYIIEHYVNENILYVVTGSPLFYSAATLMTKYVPKEHLRFINNTSCKNYLLEKLMISELDVGIISLHGKTVIDLNVFLQKPYTFVVCDEKTIARLQEALHYFDAKSIETTIGYKLGYEDECIETIDIFNVPSKFDTKAAFVLLLKKEFISTSVISLDKEFETERGMITKKYKRQLSLQNLDLVPNEILWDVGAGSGSCGIEAFKRYKVKTIFFEKNPTRIEFIKANLKTHFVCDTLLLEGEAQELFDSVIPNPHKIFVGGGGEKVIAKLPYLYDRLEPEGIMLINAITMKHLSQMIQVLNDAQIKYELNSLSLTTYKGKLDLVEPERQLFQIKVYK